MSDAPDDDDIPAEHRDHAVDADLIDRLRSEGGDLGNMAADRIEQLRRALGLHEREDLPGDDIGEDEF